jgi:hypothetical protein
MKQRGKPLPAGTGQCATADVAPGHPSERERTKAAAAECLALLKPIEEWIHEAPRSAEEIQMARQIDAELRAMAIHGYESTVEFVSVHGVIQTVNGLPYAAWKAQQDAYHADVTRFLK